MSDLNALLEAAIDALIDAARALEWHNHFGSNWDKWRDELAYARQRVIAAAQGIEAGTDETLKAAQPEGQEPGRLQPMRPTSSQVTP